MTDLAQPIMFNMLDLVGISNDFARSVNIDRDLISTQDDRAGDFVPTKAAEECLKLIADGTQPLSKARAFLLFGPYGCGKSHFGLVIARLMQSGISHPAIQRVLDRVSDGAIRTIATDRFRDLDPRGTARYLTVILHGNEGAFRDAMLNALGRALEAEGHEDVLPRTVYRAALDRITDWRNNHPHSYAQFEQLLQRDGETVLNFQIRLEKYDASAYEKFRDLHLQVSAGAGFNPNELSRAHDVYNDVARSMRTRGFAGIYIVWDEFGIYIEGATRSLRQNDNSAELLDIQEFIEKSCQASREDQVHFLALAHRSLTEYAALAGLAPQHRDLWSRISGRFQSKSLASGASDRDTYSVLSRVVTHGISWDKFLQSGGRSAIADQARASRSLFDWDEATVVHLAVQCYPLHPTTAYILPRLSSAIAQNARTLFTYASDDQSGSMRDFLARADSFASSKPVFVPVHALFDYFETALKAERPTTWDQYIQAKFDHAADEFPETVNAILKTMAIWDTVKVNVMPLTADACWLTLARLPLDRPEFDGALDRLKSRGVIFERSDGVLLFAGVDRQSLASKLVSTKGELRAAHDPVRFLREEAVGLSLDALKAPRLDLARYSNLHKTERTVSAHLISPIDEQKMRDLVKDLEKSSDQAEGLICFVLCQTDEQIRVARDKARTLLKHERVFVVIPARPLEIGETTLDVASLLQLRQEPPYSSPGSPPSQMLADRLHLAVRELSMQLEQVYRVNINDGICELWNSGQLVPSLGTSSDIETYIIDWLTKVYSSNLDVGDEQLAKRPLTSVSYRQATFRNNRQEVIKQILVFERLTPAEREYLTFSPKSSQARFVRNLLHAHGFLTHTVATWRLQKPSAQRFPVGSAVFDLIHDFFFGERNRGRTRAVSDLTRKLAGPPYGLYSPVMGMLVAVVIRDQFPRLRFIRDGQPLVASRNTPSDIVDELVFSPDNYKVVYEQASDFDLAWAEVIIQTFDGVPPSGDSDPLKAALQAFQRWGRALPAYTKRSQRLDEAVKAVRNLAVREVTDEFRFVHSELQSALGASGVPTEEGEPRLEALTRLLKIARLAIDGCHQQLAEQIISVVGAVFGEASAEASTVLAVVRNSIRTHIRRADPEALQPIFSHVRILCSWAEEEHSQADRAFESLAVAIVDKRELLDWVDSDLDTLRAKLITQHALLRDVRAAPLPPSGYQVQYLTMLAGAVGGDTGAVADAADPIAAVGAMCGHWFGHLTDFARETRRLPKDAIQFRDAMRLARTQSRTMLLDTLPDQLGISADIDALNNPEAVNRVRLRLNTLSGRIAKAEVNVEAVMCDAVKSALRLRDDADSNTALAEARKLVSEKVAAATGTPIPQPIARLQAALESDMSASDVWLALGGLYGAVAPANAWTDADVSHATDAIRKVGVLVNNLRPGRDPRTRIILNVGGGQASADVISTATVRALGEELERELDGFIDARVLRVEGKVLALASVLQKHINRIVRT